MQGCVIPKHRASPKTASWHKGVIISEDTELPPAMLVACEAAMLSQFAPQTERKPGALGSSGAGLDWREPFDPLAWKALTFRWKVGLAGTSLTGAFLAIGAASCYGDGSPPVFLLFAFLFGMHVP